jgi:hypothetical protein
MPFTNRSAWSPAIACLASCRPAPEIALITGAKTVEAQSGWLESREKGETVVDSPDDHSPMADFRGRKQMPSHKSWHRELGEWLSWGKRS